MRGAKRALQTFLCTRGKGREMVTCICMLAFVSVTLFMPAFHIYLDNLKHVMKHVGRVRVPFQYFLRWFSSSNPKNINNRCGLKYLKNSNIDRYVFIFFAIPKKARESRDRKLMIRKISINEILQASPNHLRWNFIWVLWNWISINDISSI